jgi:hypothetical protein
MAEIMFHNALLRQEYLHMLVSYMCKDGEEMFQDGNYLEHPFLQRGLLWGVGRLCQRHGKEIASRRVYDNIVAYLSSRDHHVAGLAIWCLGLLGEGSAATEIEGFRNHPGEVRLFIDTTLKITTVAALAEEALQRLCFADR